MKKIIVFLCIQLSFISQIFAANLDFSSNKNTYSLWEEIILEINIENDSKENITIESIEWLENFHQSGQARNSQTSIINWKINSREVLQLTLYPKNSWNFTLWPVNISLNNSEELQSDTINISVTDENWVIKESQENTTESHNNSFNNSEQSENKNNSSQFNIQESSEINNNSEENSQNNKNFIESKNLEINFVKILLISIGFILFFSLFYFVLTKLLWQNNSEKNEIIIEEKSQPKDFHQEIISQLEQLSQDSDNLEKTQFYRQLNIIFRNYFVFLWIQNAHKKTYEELKKQNIEEKIFTMFMKSYFEEYNHEDDSQSQRKQMIMNFIIYLK